MAPSFQLWNSSMRKWNSCEGECRRRGKKGEGREGGRREMESRGTRRWCWCQLFANWDVLMLVNTALLSGGRGEKSEVTICRRRSEDILHQSIRDHLPIPWRVSFDICQLGYFRMIFFFVRYPWSTLKELSIRLAFIRRRSRGTKDPFLSKIGQANSSQLMNTDIMPLSQLFFLLLSLGLWSLAFSLEGPKYLLLHSE